MTSIRTSISRPTTSPSPSSSGPTSSTSPTSASREPTRTPPFRTSTLARRNPPAAFRQRRPALSYLSAISGLLDYHGASTYNGLKVHFQHRFTHGLEFTTAYALVPLMDNQGGDTNGARNETQIPTAKEWANGLTDLRHNLTIAFVWQLPKLRAETSRRARVLNGWGINGIFQFITGSPVFVDSVSGRREQRQRLRAPRPRPWPASGSRPQNRSPSGSIPLPSPRPSATMAARRAIRAALVGLARSILSPSPIRQELSHAFRGAAAPGFPPGGLQRSQSRPSSALPSGSQGSSTFGKITSTKIDNRELQGVVKYYF